MLCTLVFVSCIHKPSDSQKEDEEVPTKELSDSDQIRKIVEDWNRSLNEQNRKLSNSVFAPEVAFYTAKLSPEECTDLRLELVRKDPMWSQTIIDPIKVSDNGNGIMIASFTKEVTTRKGVQSYPAYLEFKRFGGKWKIIKESDEITDKNVSMRKVPKDAIRGDFDGDGQIDHVWISAKYDEYDFATTPLTLKSDNPKLEGLKWRSGFKGVILVNLGDLNNSHRDFLGAIPHGDSVWVSFETYGFKDLHWKKVIPSFTAWLGDDVLERVQPSSRKGYVWIRENDMNDADDMWTSKDREVKLNW